MRPEIDLQAFAAAHAADGAFVIDVREPGVDAVSVVGGTSAWAADGHPVVRGAHAGRAVA